jgi:hypothetical protein
MLNYHKDGVSDSMIKALIEICWVKPNINQDMYCTGCKILGMDPESKIKLEETVHALEFDSELKIRRVSFLESDLPPKKTH